MHTFIQSGRFLLVSAILVLFPLSSRPGSNHRPEPTGQQSGLYLPKLEADDDLARSAGLINFALRDQYRNFVERRGQVVDVASSARSLAGPIGDLIKKDAALKKLGESGIEGIVRHSAERDRVQAFVHAWALFSLLAAEADRTGADMKPLVALDSSACSASVLSQLLTLAEQIIVSGEHDEEYQKAKKSAKGIDLLQYRLADPVLFPIELAYDQEWKDAKKPGFVKNGRYIPSFHDLIGTSADSPEPRRDLLSLWGVVNLIADRDCRLIDEEDKNKLGGLADWLALLRHRSLKAFQAASDGTVSIEERFTGPLARIEKFLRFRQTATNSKALAAIADQLTSFRRENNISSKNPKQAREDLLHIAGEKSPALKQLIEAAEPMGSSGQRLHHAAAWLRYVLLLSYKGERGIVGDPTAANCMEKGWEIFATGLPVDWVADAKTWDEARTAPAIRWNQLPYAGQGSAVVADLSSACLAYLRFEHAAGLREKERFAALSSITAAKTYYTKEFTADLASLDGAYRSRLLPYFVRNEQDAIGPSPGTPPLPFGEPARLSESPVEGAAPEVRRWSTAFKASTTPAERQRLRDDLAVLAVDVHRTIKLQIAIQKALRDGTPGSLQMFASLGGPGVGDLGAMPRRTFPQYKKELDERIKELKDSVTQAEAERSLVQAYKQSREELEQARAELDAARLGRRIADKASELSECFKEIAALDVRITELGERMALLEMQAQKEKGAAAELRLVVATRLRDLAARKVEALIAASKQAEVIAEQAIQDIENLKNEFEQAARTMKDRKARERAFGILKAVISVVGAAVAPFTGGASLTVAMLVNTAVDIYKRIDETNWKDFGAAVATVGAVAEDAGAIVETGINKFGGSKAKAALKDVKGFINKERGKLEELKGDARKLWDGLEKIGKDRIGVAVALANGFPVSLDEQGRLRIRLGEHKLQFSDPELQKALKVIFDNGRYILNDLDGRGEAALGKLTALPPAELKAKLGEALGGAMKELPTDISKSIKGLPLDAREKADAALKQLQDHVSGAMSDDTRRLLAQALAGGMLFAKEKDVVIAIERPFAEEARKLEVRLEAYGRRVAEGEIAKVVGKISEIRDGLEKKGQELIKANDDEALEVLAKTRPKEAIEDVHTQVNKLKDEIDKAKDELIDKEDDRTIVDYEAKAARLLADNARYLVEQAKLHKQRAALVLKQAKLAAEMEVLRGEQADLLVNAANSKVVRLEMAVRYRFDRCVANGVNPLSSDAANPEKLPVPMASLRGVLNGHIGLLDLVNRPIIEAAASDILGMIQWCKMLGLSTQTMTPSDFYAELVSVIVSSDPLWATKGGKDKSVGGRIDVMGQMLSKLFEAKSGEYGDVVELGAEVKLSNIVWRDGKGSRGVEVEYCLQDVPEEFRKNALGVFRYRITVSGADGSSLPATTRDVFPPREVLLDASASYFVDLANVNLIIRRPNIYVVIIPPAVAHARSDRPVIYGPLKSNCGPLKPRKAALSELSDFRRNQIKKDLGLLKGVDFTGALGEWTIIILDSDAVTPSQRATATDAFRKEGDIITLQMFYLQVKPRLVNGK